MAYLLLLQEGVNIDRVGGHLTKKRLLALMLAANGLALTQACAQQFNRSVGPFDHVVQAHFDEWDTDRDGQLSKEEIQAALVNPDFHDETAAALAAIAQVVLGDRYSLPPITKDYLLSSPSRETPTASEPTDAPEDEPKADKFNYAPSFRSRYFYDLRQLRRTSRELFPQSAPPSFEATHQGYLDDCPFVSTVGAMLSRDPSAVQAMFAPNGNGATVTFGNGSSFEIAEPTDAEIALWSNAGTNGLWLTILEKAYRTALATEKHPDPEGRPSIYDTFRSPRTVEILDGHRTMNIAVHGLPSESPWLTLVRKGMVAAQSAHLLVEAATPAVTKTPGITHNHAYAILGYDEEKDLVHVWNPHRNNFTPNGPEGLENGYTTKAGEFDIPLNDLTQIFSVVSLETQGGARN